MTWRAWKRQHSHPQQEWTEQYELMSFADYIRGLCVQVLEETKEGWPLLIVGRDTWEAMREEGELRRAMQFNWLGSVFLGEMCMLYGVHIVVNWQPGEWTNKRYYPGAATDG